MGTRKVPAPRPYPRAPSNDADEVRHALHIPCRRIGHRPKCEQRRDRLMSLLIDRAPRTLDDTAPLSAAIEMLLDGSPWGIPVVNSAGSFRGVCTPRSVLSLCQLISNETAAMLPSLSFMHDDMARIRRRLAGVLDAPIVNVLDPFVPTLRPSASIPEIFFHLYRTATLLPVVDDTVGRRLVGVITYDRVIRAALDRLPPESTNNQPREEGA